ncbi:hypothetical protein JW960_01630 [candidate division KSB1 bacterium]|nr:hypothetical protein [candidate division KSB1 bacterium]
MNATRRPVLVGTSSIEDSTLLATMLQREGVSCNVLNAKRDAFEAAIVAEAGTLGAVTIATNMAGRGTDIALGGADSNERNEVRSLGGLYVIGTNKHESARIDDQLRGRAGRQGDPGSSRFFVSLDDDLMLKYRIDQLLPAHILAECDAGPVTHPLVRAEINRIQRIVDGQNSEIKLTLTKYSSLIEKQRRFIHEKRAEMMSVNSAANFYMEKRPAGFHSFQTKFTSDEIDKVCRSITLFHMDHQWAQFLEMINDVREGIHLRSLGGQEPFIEFNKIVIEEFPKLLDQIEADCITTFDKLSIDGADLTLDSLGVKAPSATWTYLVTDKPFENMLGLQMIGNIGISVAAGLYWPIILLAIPFRRWKSKNLTRRDRTQSNIK